MSNVELPVELPISFVKKTSNGTVKLPATLPINFTASNSGFVARLPVTLPLKFEAVGQIKRYTIIEYKEKVNLDRYFGVTTLPFYECSVGKTVKIPYTENAWRFPGLVLQECILSHVNKQVTLSENVQSLILVDFELVSTNTLKIKWYGNSVPSFTIMKKSAVDDTYKEAGKFNWTDESATFDIESEDYNVYLQGSENSGTSAVYTIAGANDTLVIPDVEVLLNEKIYEADINYISEYHFVINY